MEIAINTVAAYAQLKPDAMVLEGTDLFNLMADIITRSCDSVRRKKVAA